MLIPSPKTKIELQASLTSPPNGSSKKGFIIWDTVCVDTFPKDPNWIAGLADNFPKRKPGKLGPSARVSKMIYGPSARFIIRDSFVWLLSPKNLFGLQASLTIPPNGSSKQGFIISDTACVDTFPKGPNWIAGFAC